MKQHVIDILLGAGISIPENSISFRVIAEKIVFTALQLGPRDDYDVYTVDLEPDRLQALAKKGVSAGQTYPLEVWRLVGFHPENEKYRCQALRALRRLESADSRELREQILDSVDNSHSALMFAGVLADYSELSDDLLRFYCKCEGAVSGCLDISTGLWPLRPVKNKQPIVASQ